MSNDITYNQLIRFRRNASIKCKQIKKSFTEKGSIILFLDNFQKIIISGKSIDTSGHRKRIRELITMAEEKGINIPGKSIKHYANNEDNKYVLVKL